MPRTQIVFNVPYSVAAAWDRTPGMIQDRIEAEVLWVIKNALGFPAEIQDLFPLQERMNKLMAQAHDLVEAEINRQPKKEKSENVRP